jgi:hypothetical protein
MQVLTDANSIPIVSKDLLDSQITDNHVGSFLDQPETCKFKSPFAMLAASNLHSEPGQNGIRVLADDAGVAAYTSLIRSLGNLSTDNDNLFGVPRHGRSESSVGRHSGGGTASAASGASILASIAGSSLNILLARVFL